MDPIVIEKLTKRYGRRTGVVGLDLRVPGGSLYGFLGPNGAGKTTTIRALMGFLKPTSGSARVQGLDCWEQSARIKAQVGYLPGDLRLYPWLTCRIALAISQSVRKREVVRHGTTLAEALELDPSVKVRNMSRGMRQKLGIILAMAHDPELLILDEPTASLDPIIQEKLYRQLRRLVEKGRTVFLSSHTLGEVQQWCDRVAVLRRGTVVAESSLADLRSRADRIITMEWLSDAPLNEVEPPAFLRIHERDGVRWWGSLRGDSGAFIRWCATQPIRDVTIGEPDLTRVFHAFYESDGPT